MTKKEMIEKIEEDIEHLRVKAKESGMDHLFSQLRKFYLLRLTIERSKVGDMD